MRENLYKQFQTDDGTYIYDSTSVDWSKFEWTNGYIKHFISTEEISKPYLISYAYYGSINYEDIILLINNIANIFEVVPNMEIKIPNIIDIKNFMLKYRS
jgi:hypothetical protein